MQTDTTSVCTRNSIADITFTILLIFNNLDQSLINVFLLYLLKRTRLREAETKATLVKHLKPGQILPEKPLND